MLANIAYSAKAVAFYSDGDSPSIITARRQRLRKRACSFSRRSRSRYSIEPLEMGSPENPTIPRQLPAIIRAPSSQSASQSASQPASQPTSLSVCIRRINANREIGSRCVNVEKLLRAWGPCNGARIGRVETNKILYFRRQCANRNKHTNGHVNDTSLLTLGPEHFADSCSSVRSTRVLCCCL